MTNEELERAMTFLLESQAALSAKVDANTEAIARLTSISERHDSENAELRKDTREMQAEVREMQVEVREMQAEIRNMRSETRDAVNTILGVAESMAEHVKSLTAITLDTRLRLEVLDEGRT